MSKICFSDREPKLLEVINLLSQIELELKHSEKWINFSIRTLYEIHETLLDIRKKGENLDD